MAISLLSPLGSIFSSYDFLPNNDWRAHSGLVIQAKMAIEEGQFPIRVSPWEHQQLRYPEYQFYGVFPFTLSGYLYKILTYSHSVILKNPFNTLKMLLLFSISLGGFFAYRFSKLFTKSDVIALLAATAYIFSPYLNFNINVNGDFTDAFAQSILPIALYYSFSILFSKKIKLGYLIFSSISWFVILTTHLVTFAYSSLFFVLASILFFLLRLTSLKNFFYAVLSIGYSWILAAWYIVPVVLLASHLAASGGATGANAGNGLSPTSIFNIFAFRSGGTDISPSYPGFYAAIGWPFLFGFIGSIYFLLWPRISRYNKQYKIMLGVSILFTLAMLMTWSWINIWKYLPYFFSIGQFGHRFLAQLSWLGMILFVLSTLKIFGERLDERYLVVGLFLICFSGSSWIVKPEDGVKVASLLSSPNFYIGSTDYFIRSDTLPPYPGLEKYGFVQIPLLRVDSQLFLNREIKLPPRLFSPSASLFLKGKTLKKAKPGKLELFLNRSLFATYKIKPNKNVNWKIQLSSFPGAQFVTMLLVEKEDKSKSLPIDVTQFEIQDNQHQKILIYPVEKSKSLCAQNKSITECHVNFTQKTGIQLPIFYYPQLLTVALDDNNIQYQGTFYKNPFFNKKNENFDPEHDINPYIVATIIAPPGKHTIIIKNNGIAWANKVSLIGWFLVLLTGCLMLYFHYFRKVN